GWPGCRGGRSDPDDSVRATPGAPLPGSRLSLPGLRAPVRPGPSHPPLGPRWPHDALESRPALPATPPCGSRGRLPDGATAGQRVEILPSRRPTLAPCATASRGTRRSRGGHSSAARSVGALPPRAELDAELAGGGAQLGLLLHSISFIVVLAVE